MSIKNCKEEQSIKHFIEELFNKGEDLPNEAIKSKNYKFQYTYLFEVIKYAEIIDIIKSIRIVNKIEKFYISVGSEEETIYEMVIDDDDFGELYETFMFWPESIPHLKQPKHPFAMMYSTIYIFNEKRDIVIIGKRYFDITSVYVW